ncbi:MAG: hypothetical protein GY856_22595 [bacterium]|nr:hypothetical protein [bacterium]
MAKSRRETLSRIRRRVSEMPPLSTGARVVLAIGGWVLIMLGVLQLFIPGPGLLTMVTGAALLSLVSRRVHNLLRWIFRPWPWAWQKLLQLRRRIRERFD